MKKISDRILKIVQNEGISIRSLERKISCSNGVLAKCIQKGTDINSLWLSKIIETLPAYNADWLLTGRGEMLICKNDGNANGNNIPGYESRIDEIIECEKCPIIDEVITFLRQQTEAHIMLIKYLEEKKAWRTKKESDRKLGKLDVKYKKNKTQEKEESVINSNLFWTESWIALVELIYAIYSIGAVNHGITDIKVLKEVFEKIFHIELGDLYHSFTEMRLRKKDRAKFIDHLKVRLINRMD